MSIRVLQIIGGRKPTDNGRDNIFVHRQVNSLKPLIPNMRIIYAGFGSTAKDMILLAKKIRYEVKTLKPHVIHSQYATITGAVTVLFSSQIPTIVSFGGDEVYGTYVSEYSTRSLRTRFALKFSSYCAKNANVSIVKNEQMRSFLEKWDANCIEVIPNGVNLHLFRELNQKSCRTQLDLAYDIRYVVFAVRDNDCVKRRDLAEKAVRLCNIASSQKVELLILEVAKPNEIPFYLNAGDVLLLCSNHEGSPNIIKEALACNRPVVSTDVGDVRDRFGSVNGLFLVKKDPINIAEGLKRAMRLEKSNGRDFVTSLSEEVIAQKLFHLYRSISKI